MQLVSQEEEAIVIREAITLIGQIYQCDCNSEDDNLKMYKVMVKVALRGNNHDVQEQAVKFWDQVTKKLLEKQGMRRLMFGRLFTFLYFLVAVFFTKNLLRMFY